MGNRGETQAASVMRDRRTRFPDISSSVPNTNQHGNTALHNNVPTPQYKPATYQLHIKRKEKNGSKKKKKRGYLILKKFSGLNTFRLWKAAVRVIGIFEFKRGYVPSFK